MSEQRRAARGAEAEAGPERARVPDAGAGASVGNGGSPAEDGRRPRGIASGVNRVKQAWTAERVIASVRSWAAEYGEPPTSTEWEVGKPEKYAQAALAKARSWEEKAARFNAGAYPSNDTCRRLFGTFSATLTAAGFEPRPKGRTPRKLTRLHQEKLRIRMKGDSAGASQLAQHVKSVMAARAARDDLALRGALLDLAATAMTWAERLPAAEAA